MEIPAFVENSQENPTLYMIHHLRSLLALNIIDFYDLFMTRVINVVNSSLKDKRMQKSELLTLLRNFKPSSNPEEKIVDLNVSLCEFAEYVNFLKNFTDSKKLADEDLEYLVSISVYFGYLGRSDPSKWEDCSSLVIKVLNSYTNDADRSEGFLHYNGFYIYEIFRNNQSLPKKYLKDINVWVLAGYKFKLEELGKDYDDISDSIDREEYSEPLLQKCEENLKTAWKVYKSFMMLTWNVSTLNIKYAEKVIHVHEDAIQKIKTFKD
jgi:hypothetical protein